jgi:VWFA-related protein
MIRTLLLCVALLASLPAFGQRPVFRATVDVVRVDALATDHGRPVPGLTARDFELLDNGVPQQIELVAAGDLPLDVTLVFDVSSSVSGTVLEQLKSAGSAVIASLKPSDRVALWTFSHRISAPVPLTADFERVRGAIDRLQGEGATSLLDAVYAALASRPDSPKRSLVLLFSDGKDNRSWLTEDDVVQAAAESGTVVYAVAFNPPFVMTPAGPVGSLGVLRSARRAVATQTPTTI